MSSHIYEEMNVDVLHSTQYKSYSAWKFLSTTICQAQTSENGLVSDNGSQSDLIKLFPTGPGFQKTRYQ